MSAKRGTYLIEFNDGTQIVCGNNYKDWCTHATEYAWYKYQDNRPHLNLLTSVKFSDTPFVDDGGLKWASPEAYQQVINEMMAERAERITPFNEIEFSFSNRDKKRLDANLKYWGLI